MLHASDQGPPRPWSPIKAQTVWWVLAGCLIAIVGYVFFRSATASYNSVSLGGGYSVQQVACLSVYGWVRGEGPQLSSTQLAELSPNQQASFVACHAAIGDRETTIKILVGVAIVFAFVAYLVGQADARENREGTL